MSTTIRSARDVVNAPGIPALVRCEFPPNALCIGGVRTSPAWF
ncbi:hypothetical protein [Mycolicibacterium aromaticivorans]|nr:hypothetical protein [Mycolicibacterium aromaticivorans]